MKTAHRIAFVGFSTCERHALTEAFERAHDAGLHSGVNPQGLSVWRVIARWDQADFIVADAELPGATRVVLEEGRVGEVFFIGGMGAPVGALGWLPRTQVADTVVLAVQEAVDRLLQERQAAPAAPSAALDSLRAFDEMPALRQGSRRPLVGLHAALVVSADANERHLLRDALAQQGCEVYACDGRDAALAHTRGQSFNFVMLGASIAGQDALETCRLIKRDGHTASLPLVALVHPAPHPLARWRASWSGVDTLLHREHLAQEVQRVVNAHSHQPLTSFEPTAPLLA